jgi:hypothetical protein
MWLAHNIIQPENRLGSRPPQQPLRALAAMYVGGKNVPGMAKYSPAVIGEYNFGPAALG